MGIQSWSEDVIIVNLAQEPQMGEELQTVIEMVGQNGDCNVVVDFTDVDIITSSSIAKLLRLRKALVDCGHRLVFSSVSSQTKKIFTITGLENVFEFVQDRFLALAGLQMVN